MNELHNREYIPVPSREICMLHLTGPPSSEKSNTVSLVRFEASLGGRGRG